MAKDDEVPNDPDVVLLPEGSTLEGVIADMSEIDTEFGPTPLVTLEGTEHGTVKILGGAKILADLFAAAGQGDFVSIQWDGKKMNKAGTLRYRSFSVAHTPAPGSGREAHTNGPGNAVQERLPIGGNPDADLDDDPL
jgi:hypothetical protein